jgi:iron complex outermembrane receptor protein
MRKQIFTTFILISHFLSLNAQVDVDLLMDTLNIPAVNIPKAISMTGRNVSVITAKDIRLLPVTTTDELLRYLPGIEVQSRNGFGAQSDISMRGSTYQQVIVVIDGMRMNAPLTAHFNANIPIAPAEIARIEVLRGPAAAVYGPDAVGGVINIVTKTFLITKKGQSNSFNADGEVNYGQHNLLNGNVGFRGRVNDIKLNLSGLLNQSDGELVAEQYSIDGNDTVPSYNNYFDVRTATLSVAIPVENWQIGLRGAVDVRDFSARYFYTNSTFDQSEEVTSNVWLQTQAKHVGENSSTDINLTYRYGTDTFAFLPSVPSFTNMHATQTYFGQINHLRNINETFDLKFGAQFDYRTIESNDRGNHDDIHAGIYAIGVLRPFEGFNVTASLRADYEETYGIQALPQISASYYVNDKITLRANAGRSIRAADYTERYNNYNKINVGGGRSVGNPDLKTEISWSEEIGIDFYPIPEWRLTATAFARQGTDLIDFVNTIASDINNVPDTMKLSDDTEYFYAQNISSVTTYGIEFESWYTRQITNKMSASWNLGYTFLSSSNSDDIISTYLSNHAKHLVTTNLIFNYDRIEVAINGLFKDRTGRVAVGSPSGTIDASLADSYMVLNGKISIRVIDGLSVNFMAHNILNEQYADFLGAKMPSRWLMAGVKWNL